MTSTSTPAAPAPLCPECGAPLPVDLASPEVACESCGARHAVDAGLRERMYAWIGDVRALVHAEVEARFHAAFYAQNEKATAAVLVGVVGFALMLVIGGGAVGLSLHRPGGTPLALLAFVFPPWAASVAAAAWGWHTMFDVPRPEALLAVAAGRCTRCGAVRTFAAGTATGKCTHCEGTLFVPLEVAASLLAETGARAAAAAKRKRAALKKTDAGSQRYVQPLVLVVVVGVPVLLAAVVGLLLLGGPSVPGPVAVGLMVSPVVLAAPFVVRAPLVAGRRHGEVDALTERLLSVAQKRGQASFLRNAKTPGG